MTRTILSLLVIASISGCAYNVPTISVAPTNIYTTYENKIPGNFALIVDDSVTNVSRQVRSSSHVCSAHTFPIVLGDSAASSINRLMESLFDNITTRSTMPTSDEMKRGNLKAAVVVKLDSFEPRVTCSMGFWSGSCTASADVSFGLVASGPSGRLAAFSSGGSKSADGDAGGACEGAARVLGDAISKSMKDALERMGERIANSQTLRQAQN